MLYSITALALLSSALAATPTLIVERAITYNCPSGQAIDNAYYDYCPANPGNSLSLQGINTIVQYTQSNQGDYQTQKASDLKLNCDYGLAGGPCGYSGGGGSPLSGSASNNGACPVLSSKVALSSAGSNLRRRDVLGGVTPRFTCPHSATDGTAFTSISNIYAGTSAAAKAADGTINQTPGTATGAVLYGCQITSADFSETAICYYSQADDSSTTATFFGVNNLGDSSLCPTTICSAIDDGTYSMKRRRSLADQAAIEAIQSRQVDTGALRLRASGKGRSRQRNGSSRWSTE